MAGVMSLMQPQGQQSPMPGQAPQQPMQGMMPQQGAATPAAMVGPLTQMHMQQLMQLMLNPRPEGPPLYAVISALAEKQKAAKAAQNAQGQQAMAQNAQMQQQPPVAAQVMQAAEQMPQQQTQMAAHGGIMHGYAGGGAVSFKYAGYVPPREEGESFEDYRQRVMRFQEQKLAEEKIEARRKTQEYYAGELAARKGLARPSPFTGQGQQVDASKLFPFGPPESPMMDVPEIQVAPSSAPAPQPSPTTFDISSPSSINALRIAAQDTSLPESERADLQRRIAMMGSQRSTPAASTPPGMAIQGEMSPEERKTYADYRAMMEGRKVRPESLVKAEQGLGELAQANIAAQRAESERMAREAQERRDAAIGRSQRSILSGPKSLLDLAGGIDTRRGQGIGSLARSAAGLLGQREASAEAARKEYATAQQAQRAMDAAIRQTQMLEAQRQVAVETGKYDLVNQLDEKIAQSRMAEQTAARDVRNKSIEQARLERIATAQEVEAGAKATTAGRPTETTRLLQELGLTPTLESLGALAGARQPVVSGERQDLAELKTLQSNLQKQVENYMIPKTQRDAAALQLQQVNAKLAQMAGLGGATVPTGGAIRPSSQAEFDALPKGARYINPADGKEYTKN